MHEHCGPLYALLREPPAERVAAYQHGGLRGMAVHYSTRRGHVYGPGAAAREGKWGRADHVDVAWAE